MTHGLDLNVKKNIGEKKFQSDFIITIVNLLDMSTYSFVLRFNSFVLNLRKRRSLKKLDRTSEKFISYSRLRRSFLLDEVSKYPALDEGVDMVVTICGLEWPPASIPANSPI